jgi:hypothetical protein
MAAVRVGITPLQQPLSSEDAVKKMLGFIGALFLVACSMYTTPTQNQATVVVTTPPMKQPTPQPAPQADDDFRLPPPEGTVATEGYGFKVYRHRPPGQVSTEIIVTPTGGQILGAPRGLACASSYDCRAVAFVKHDGTTYLVAQRQIYRYGKIKRGEDEGLTSFELVHAFGKNVTAVITDISTEDTTAFVVFDTSEGAPAGIIAYQGSEWRYLPITPAEMRRHHKTRLVGLPNALERQSDTVYTFRYKKRSANVTFEGAGTLANN